MFSLRLPFIEQEQQLTQEGKPQQQQHHPDDITAVTSYSEISHSSFVNITRMGDGAEGDVSDDPKTLQDDDNGKMYGTLVPAVGPLHHSTSCDDLASCGDRQRRRRSSCSSMVDDISRRGSFAALDLSESQSSLISSLKLLEMEIILDHSSSNNNNHDDGSNRIEKEEEEEAKHHLTTDETPLHDKMMKTFFRNVETIYHMLTTKDDSVDDSKQQEHYPFLERNEILYELTYYSSHPSPP